MIQNVSAIYSLCLNTLQKEAQLNELISKTNLLVNEPRLDPWLAKILITELLWGKKVLNTDCKPGQTIRSYEKQLRKELGDINDVEASNKTGKNKKYYVYLPMRIMFTEMGPSCTSKLITASSFEFLIY